MIILWMLSIVCFCVALTPLLLASSAPEWIQKYKASFIETKKLQELVDSFMVDYDKRKEEVRPSPARHALTSE